MKKILLIDDKEDIRETLSEFLQERGYETETCIDGLQGMKAVLAKDYDLIITDLLMPGVDGFSFISQFRKLPAQKRDLTPILVITGGSTAPDFFSQIETLKAKGHSILKKPFTKDQFMDSVDRALEPNKIYSTGT